MYAPIASHIEKQRSPPGIPDQPEEGLSGYDCPGWRGCCREDVKPILERTVFALDQPGAGRRGQATLRLAELAKATAHERRAADAVVWPRSGQTGSDFMPARDTADLVAHA